MDASEDKSKEGTILLTTLGETEKKSQRKKRASIVSHVMSMFEKD